MNLKEELIKLKNKLVDNDKDVSLRHKIDKFIIWYEKNMRNFFSNSPEDIRNFIEKMAVWYELRYPDYNIDNILNIEKTSVEKNKMFNKNPYINKTNDELDILVDNNKSREIFKYLEWDKFYNTNAFIQSLEEDEVNLLRKPTYDYWIFLDGGLILLSKKGTIIDGRKYLNIKNDFNYSRLIGMNIKDAIHILKDEEPYVNTDKIEKVIKDYELQSIFKEQLLDCIMYRIIERKNNIFGAYRAFLFAKEFKRNIDIPMKYGLCSKGSIDIELKKFIYDYLESGGSKELKYNTNYFSNKKPEQKNIQEIIDEIDFKKEQEQKLINVLSSIIDKEELDELLNKNNTYNKQEMLEKLTVSNNQYKLIKKINK